MTTRRPHGSFCPWGRGEESFAGMKLGVSYFRWAGVHRNVIGADDHEFAFIEIELKN